MESESAKPIDRDVACVQCGYNLRGLAGAPVICPECGFRNPRRKPAGIEYFTECRWMRLRGPLDTSAYGLVAIVAAMVALLIFGITWQIAAVLAGGVGVFLWGAYSFNRKCHSLGGRMRAFCIYQAAIAGTISAVGVILLECLRIPALPLPFVSPAWRVGVAVAVLVTIVFGPLRRARRRVQKLASIAEYAAAVDFEYGCRELPSEIQSREAREEEPP